MFQQLHVFYQCASSLARYEQDLATAAAELKSFDCSRNELRAALAKTFDGLSPQLLDAGRLTYHEERSDRRWLGKRIASLTRRRNESRRQIGVARQELRLHAFAPASRIRDAEPSAWLQLLLAEIEHLNALLQPPIDLAASAGMLEHAPDRLAEVMAAVRPVAAGTDARRQPTSYDRDRWLSGGEHSRRKAPPEGVLPLQRL